MARDTLINVDSAAVSRTPSEESDPLVHAKKTKEKRHYCRCNGFQCCLLISLTFVFIIALILIGGHFILRATLEDKADVGEADVDRLDGPERLKEGETVFQSLTELSGE